MSHLVRVPIEAWTCSVGLQAPRVYRTEDEARARAGQGGVVTRIEIVRAVVHDPWSPGPRTEVPLSHLWVGPLPREVEYGDAVLLAYSTDGWSYLVER